LSLVQVGWNRSPLRRRCRLPFVSRQRPTQAPCRRISVPAATSIATITTIATATAIIIATATVAIILAITRGRTTTPLIPTMRRRRLRLVLPSASARGGEQTPAPTSDGSCNRVSPGKPAGVERLRRLVVRQCASPTITGAHIHVAFTLSSLTSFEAITNEHVGRVSPEGPRAFVGQGFRARVFAPALREIHA